MIPLLLAAPGPHKKHGKKTIRTGAIYDRYNKICRKHTEEPLSNRRISDYIKDLELLNLIQAEYHYGGQKGKTRDISLNSQT